MKVSIGFIAILGCTLAAAQPVAPVPPVPAVPSTPGLRFFGAGSGSFLGVGVAEITSERARGLNLKDDYGVEITRVDGDSPAEKAGLKAGDVVLEYNGQRVEGIEQFQRLVRETPAGRTVRLLISRNGSNQTLSAVVGSRKSGMFGPEGFAMPRIEIPDIPNVFTGIHSSALGIEVESLGPQLADYFGVKEGVLVRSVVKGSVAEKAGLKAGDVITKVNDMRVATPGEISSAVRNARSQRTFPLQITRERHEMTINVTMDEDHGSRQAPGARPILNQPL
jgi:serine protease Do